MRVLIYDDHVLFAESFAAMLAALGHEVADILPFPPSERPARHGTGTRPAVEVDVCIVDPGTAELDAARKGLRALAAMTVSGALGAEPCPVVVLTAEEDRSAENLRSLLDAQIRGVVSKRRGTTEILEALAVVHRGGSYFDPELVRRALTAGGARTSIAAAPTAADRLTQRELEVLNWLVHGAATTDMATAMGISAATVRSHIKAVFAKLGVGSRLQAAARAIALGLVEPPLG